jgi:hypothetical protein
MTVNPALSESGGALAWTGGGGGGGMLLPSRGDGGLRAGNAGTLGSSRLSDHLCTRARWRNGGPCETCMATGPVMDGDIGAGSEDMGTGENCTRRRLSGRTRSSSTGPGCPSSVGAPACCVE